MSPDLARFEAITRHTTLAELRTATSRTRPSPDFIVSNRSLQSVIQSLSVEGHQVTIDAARAAAQRVLGAHTLRTQRKHA